MNTVRRPASSTSGSGVRRGPDELHGKMPPPNRDALNGMGEFLLTQVRRGASDQQWADWLKTPFEHACIAFDMSTIRRLLEAGVNGPYDRPRDPRIRRHTLLHVASATGNTEVVMTLLRWGSVPDVAAREPGEKAYTPLHRAALSGHAEVARVLIKAGADKDARTGGSVASPLHLAARKGHEACVRTLLLTGADRNARRGLDGATPLHQAAFFGQVGAVRALLQGVADSNARDAEGCTPVFLAAQEGHKEVVEDLLANGGSPDFSREDGWTPLHAAARFGHASTALTLVTEGHADIHSVTGDHGSTPLHVAAISGFDEVLTVLMDVGSDLEATDSGGWTPLHCACAAARASCVNALLARGADPTAMTPDGQRPAALIGTDLAEGQAPNSETNESIWRMLRVPRAEFEARRRRHVAKQASGRHPPPPYHDRPPPAYTSEGLGGVYDSQGSGSVTASVTGSVSGSGKSGSRQRHRSPTPQGPNPGAGGGVAALASKDGRRPRSENSIGVSRVSRSPQSQSQGPAGNEGGGGGAAKPNSPFYLGEARAPSRGEGVGSVVSDVSPEEARVAALAAQVRPTEKQDGTRTPRKATKAGKSDSPLASTVASDSASSDKPVLDARMGANGGITPNGRSPPKAAVVADAPLVPEAPTVEAPRSESQTKGPAAASGSTAAGVPPDGQPAKGGARSPVKEGTGKNGGPSPKQSSVVHQKIRILRRRASGADFVHNSGAANGGSPTNGARDTAGQAHRSRSTSPVAKRSPKPRSPTPAAEELVLDRCVTSAPEDGRSDDSFIASRNVLVTVDIERSNERVPRSYLRPVPVISVSTASSPSPGETGDDVPEKEDTVEKKGMTEVEQSPVGSDRLLFAGGPRRSGAGRLSGGGEGTRDLVTRVREGGGGLVAQRIAAFDPFSFASRDAARMRREAGQPTRR